MGNHTSPKIGTAVLYVDEVQKVHNALVTADWSYGSNTPGSINLVFVSGDEDLDDPYGRQIVRKTSVTHQSMQSAPGFYWKEA